MKTLAIKMISDFYGKVNRRLSARPLQYFDVSGGFSRKRIEEEEEEEEEEDRFSPLFIQRIVDKDRENDAQNCLRWDNRLDPSGKHRIFFHWTNESLRRCEEYDIKQLKPQIRAGR